MTPFNPVMSPKLTAFFETIEKKTNQHSKPVVSIEIDVFDQAVNWLLTHQEWTQNYLSFSKKIFLVLTKTTLHLDRDRLSRVKDLYRNIFSSSEISFINTYVGECLKTPNSNTQTFLIQFFQTTKPKQIENLLSQTSFLKDLLQIQDPTLQDFVFKILLYYHAESVELACSIINQNEKNLILFFQNLIICPSKLNNTKLLKILINHPKFCSIICQFIQKNHLFVSFKQLLVLLDPLIPIWPAKSLVQFLIQKNSEGNFYLYSCVSNSTLLTKLLKRFPDLAKIQPENLLNYSLNLKYHWDQLESLFNNQSEIKPPSFDIQRLEILFELPSIYLAQIDVEDCINQLSNEQLSQFIEENSTDFQKLLERQEILSSFIKRGNPQAMLQLLLANGSHPLIKQHSICFDQFFKNPFHVKKLFTTHFTITYPFEAYFPFSYDSFKELSKQHQILVARTIALALFPNSKAIEEDFDLLGQYLLGFLASPSFIRIEKVLTEKVSLTDYIASKSEWACPPLLPLADQALKLKAPVTLSSLIWCIEMHNKKLLKNYLEQVDPQLIQLHSPVLLEALAMCEDMEMADLFCAKGLDIQAACSILGSFIQKSCSQMIKWLFDKNLILKDFQLAKTVFEAALESHNIEIIDLIAKHTTHIENFPYAYPDSLGLDENTPSQVSEVLQDLALHSPLPALSRFLKKHYPFLLPELDKMRPSLALLVRFPAKKDKVEINPSWDNSLTYRKDSFKYAQNNQAFIEEIVPELPCLSWQAFLSRVIQNRQKDNPALHSDYSTLRREDREVFFTPLTVACYDHRHDSTHFVPSRYFHAWNQGNRLRAASTTPGSVSTEMNTIQFYYTWPTKPSKEKLVITKLNVEMRDDYLGFRKLAWFHARSTVILECQERLEDLHKQVVQFKLTNSNQKELYELIAETYWLISTLCETARGTPHNAMIWLNAVYRRHNLPPPIPKMEHFFLDNTMLVIPVEEAIARWQTFFEDHDNQASVY